MAQSNANLPRSTDGNPIQTLAPQESTVGILTIGATSVSVALPSGADVVELSCSADIRVAFGESGVTASASSRVLPRGVYVYTVPDNATHVAILRLTASDTGFFSVVEMR